MIGKRQRRLRWNYKELIHVKLPIFKRKRIEQKLYPVEVLEQRPGRVKVHYVGYDSSYDVVSRGQTLFRAGALSLAV